MVLAMVVNVNLLKISRCCERIKIENRKQKINREINEVEILRLRLTRDRQNTMQRDGERVFVENIQRSETIKRRITFLFIRFYIKRKIHKFLFPGFIGKFWLQNGSLCPYSPYRSSGFVLFISIWSYFPQNPSHPYPCKCKSMGLFIHVWSIQVLRIFLHLHFCTAPQGFFVFIQSV